MSSDGSASLPPNPIVRTRNQEVALGMVMLGLIFSSMLYGVMQTQVYKYYRRFKSDPPSIKIMVFIVWLLNTVSMFFVGHACWYYLVTTDNPHISVWSINVELALSLVMSAISETFLTFRVYKLSGGNIWLTSLLLFMASLHFGSGEVAAVEFLRLQRFAKFGSVKIPSTLRLGSAAVTDTLIALSMCYFLNKKRTGFKRSDEIINYLILFSINSGLLTSVTSIASLVTYLVVPRLWVYTALCFLISRLYATTFLCCLNSRQILLSSTNGLNEKESPLPHRRLRRGLWSLKRGSSNDGSETPTQIDVYVVTETITDTLARNDNVGHKIRSAPSSHLHGIREGESTGSIRLDSDSDNSAASTQSLNSGTDFVGSTSSSDSSSSSASSTSRLYH